MTIYAHSIIEVENEGCCGQRVMLTDEIKTYHSEAKALQEVNKLNRLYNLNLEVFVTDWEDAKLC